MCSSSICCRATYGIGSDASNSGEQRLPERGDGGGVLLRPCRTRSRSRRNRARSGATRGRTGRAARWLQTIAAWNPAGSFGNASRAVRSACAARSCSTNRSPNCTIGPTWCSRNSNSVTTPKFPPPPRSAQNRSGCSVGARPHAAPVGQHDLGRLQVVDRQAALRGEPPEAAAEGEAADAGVADGARRDGEPVRLGGRVELRQLGAARRNAPAGRPGRPSRRPTRSDRSSARLRAAHQTPCPPPRTATRRPAAWACATAAATSCGARAARDDRRTAIDVAVVHVAGLVVARVTGLEHEPGHRRAQHGDIEMSF